VFRIKVDMRMIGPLYRIFRKYRASNVQQYTNSWGSYVESLLARTPDKESPIVQTPYYGNRIKQSCHLSGNSGRSR
jgi:hypothetical protein